MSTKKLVVCFSLTGNTRLIGKTIAKEAEADFTELVPVEQYPLRGAFLYVKGGGQASLKAEPLLEESLVRDEDYGMLIVGTPVWAWTMSPPVRTFLKSPAAKNKKIALFCTHGGGPGRCLNEMRAIALGEVLGELDCHMGKKFISESVEAAKVFAAKLKNI